MPKLVMLAGDDSILFQVAPAAGDVSAVSRSSDVIERIDESIDALFGSIASIATRLADALRDTPAQTAELEFSVEVSARGNVFVVQGESTGGIRVKLTLAPSRGD